MLKGVLALIVIGAIGGSAWAIRLAKAKAAPVNRDEQALRFTQQLFYKRSLGDLTHDEAHQVQELTKQFFL